ncbi:MAG: hypothetical protein VYB61_12065 [Verrucomicrobiota bacterium]|nr:hypothetical protein [Verrucomicrobiota bacterium]
MMKRMILSAFCAVVVFPGLAEGRLGWTHEQCVLSFGEPVTQVETRLVKSEGKADVFRAQIDDFPVFILVEYREGRVWMITYEGRGVRKKTASSLVARNAGSKVKERTFLRVQHWIEQEKKIHAVYFSSPVQRLIVMNSKSLAAEKKPIAAVILETGTTTEDPEDPEGKKEPAPVNDPLEKF